MPRLSEYLQREAPAGPSAAAHTSSRQPAAEAAAVVPSSAAAVPPAGITSPDAAVAAEIRRLQRQHAHRLRDHGPRLYRHADGQLLPHPPPREPFTVANRHRWSGLVKHCRVQQLSTGVSARYHVNTSYEQHIAALAAADMNPEVDATGAWEGLIPGMQDPLSSSTTGRDHPLTWAEWKLLTQSVLQRAMELHGQGTLNTNGWQDLWDAVDGR